MSESCWMILGIEPTGEERSIKRAYAAKLKSIDVDAQPGEFQELRGAYEAALAHRGYWSEAGAPRSVAASSAYAASGDPFVENPLRRMERTTLERLGDPERFEILAARELLRRLDELGEDGALSYIKERLESEDFAGGDAREVLSRWIAPALKKREHRPFRLIRFLAGRLEWTHRSPDFFSEAGLAIEALLREIPHAAEHAERAEEHARAGATHEHPHAGAAVPEEHSMNTEQTVQRKRYRPGVPWWVFVLVVAGASALIRICSEPPRPDLDLPVLPYRSGEAPANP